MPSQDQTARPVAAVRADTEPLHARVEAVAKALHEWTEANFVNRGKRLKWENGLVDHESYRDQARVALAAAAAWEAEAKIEACRGCSEPTCGAATSTGDCPGWVMADD